MICLTCKTPLVASAIHKTLTPIRFEMTVGCTCCHAVYKIEQLELRPADPERLKLFPARTDTRVTYCAKCSAQVTVGKESEHTCPTSPPALTTAK